MNLLNQIPCWYTIIAVLWATFQGYRGTVEHKAHRDFVEFNNKTLDPKIPAWSCKERWVILYIHDFAFRFVCTVSGFLSMYVSYFIFTNAPDLSSLSASTSALVASSFIVGVIGIGGQLHNVILLGKRFG